MLQPDTPPAVAVQTPIHFRLDTAALAGVFGEWTRGAIARRAAANLATRLPAMAWEINARGPDRLDDLGFVRLCVQAAYDWDPILRAAMWRDPIPDELLPDDGRPHRLHNPNTLGELCQAWGLIGTDFKARRPGDVILYGLSGNDAACGILLDRREREKGQGPDRVAFMRPQHWPEIYERFEFGQHPVAVFTWRDE